ncbi:MAG: hypothetical protein ACK4PG_02020 [Acetobacteraceae bacterium]
MYERHEPDIANLLDRTGGRLTRYRSFGNAPVRRPAARPAAVVQAATVDQAAPAPVAAGSAAPPLVTTPPPAPSLPAAPQQPAAAAAPSAPPPVPLPLIEAALSTSARPPAEHAGASTLARLRATVG